MNSQEALQRLIDGNQRFIDGNQRFISNAESDVKQQRANLLDGQNPFAIVLGCSDSRAPAELVFDQGLGDLFVIRVAGNIVAPSQIGSVEFAAEQFGTPLVVVLGHTLCGAINATLQQLQSPQEMRSPHLDSIVRRIQPSVQGLLNTDLKNDAKALQREAMRANVRASVNQLRHGSEILEGLIAKGQLRVVGGEYQLETGAVEFFDLA